MQVWKPKLIDHSITIALNETKMLHPQVQAEFDKLSSIGWTFWVVNQSRGRCYYDLKTITIPIFAFHKTAGYLNWYVSHECAHAAAGWKAEHGQDFMVELQRICPIGFQHYETNYKPRNAIAAGISKTPGNKIVKIGSKSYDLDLNDLF